VSAAFSVVAFLLVFALPKRVGSGAHGSFAETNQGPPAEVSR